jgi:penicillin G amidase
MRHLRSRAPLALPVLLIAMALAAPASARINRAESIIPPGNSGFVSAAGLLTGTGSPHLYDQQALFIAFRRIGDLFNPGGVTEHPKAGVSIVRDHYGVPDVSAHTSGNLWWGVGWATAEDRLVQLELERRATTGHLAEVLGKSYLDSDIEARRDYYTPAELMSMYRRLPASIQHRYAAYAAGVNAYIAQIKRNPALVPGEFLALSFTPAPYTLGDLLAIGVFLARTTPNGDGDDLTDAQALRELGPAKFNTILPLRIAGQISTVPGADGLFPSDPGRTAAQEHAALLRSARFVRSLPLPRGNQPAGHPGDPGAAADPLPAALRALPAHVLHVGGSSAIAVRDARQHRAYLFSGPELGFQAPSQLYELEVHGPGIDARGVGIPGAPIVGIGHNAHVAWGLTSGLSGTNSLYAEKLVGADHYVFDGRVRAMSCRKATFSWHTPPTASGPKTSGTVIEKLCRTVHGPVQATAGHIAYARRYATWKRELGTIVGLAALEQARSIQDVARAAATVTWNENITAADDRGNIGYWHPGLLPIRPTGWDERVPYPGTGHAEWRGLLPVSQRPHVINPRQGYLTNWNNVPSQGWTTGNDTASERLGGPWFRTAFLNRLVITNLVRRAPSFAALDATIRTEGSTAQQRPLATAQLRAALHGANRHARAVLTTILAWGGSYVATDAHGHVSPGVAAWQAFKSAAQKIAVGRLGKAAFLIGGGGTNSEHIFDVSLGQAYALRTLRAAGWRAAAAAAYTALVHQFHSGSPAAWAAPRTYANQSVLGAEKPPPMPFFDRGSWEQVVALGP